MVQTAFVGLKTHRSMKKAKHKSTRTFCEWLGPSWFAHQCASSVITTSNMFNVAYMVLKVLVAVRVGIEWHSHSMCRRGGFARRKGRAQPMSVSLSWTARVCWWTAEARRKDQRDQRYTPPHRTSHDVRDQFCNLAEPRLSCGTECRTTYSAAHPKESKAAFD